MATTLFPRTTVRAATSTFSSATTRDLAFARGAGSTTQTDATVASLTGVSVLASGGNVAPWGKPSTTALAASTAVETDATIGASLFFLSGPISAFTMSGSITFNVRALESAAQANYAMGCKIYQISGNAVVAAIAIGANGNELGTTDGAFNVGPVSGYTPVAFADGDQIGVLIFYGSATLVTSASGRTASGTYNGGSSGAVGDTFITFAETFTAFSPAVSLPFPHQSVPFYPRPSRPA